MWVQVVFKALLFFTFVFLPQHASCHQSQSPEVSEDFEQSKVNFVLVGATGNLAQKYLWQGLYDLYAANILDREQDGDRVRIGFYGGARADRHTGTATVDEILNNNVEYKSEIDRDEFRKVVSYVQLKTCEHYEAFCRDTLNSDKSDEGFCYREKCDTSASTTREFGRIFYLAVTPYSYGELAECIQRVCKPPTAGAWIRIVLEKPYGSDLASVQNLTTTLLKHFTEDEVYLVDHYLAKVIAEQVLPFRHDNRQWLEPLLNANFVDRIEIVIKEKEDAEGRLNYYDSYGVFLDILQNHGMEMLTLVAMDLSSTPEAPWLIRRQKESFLKSVAPVNPRNLLAGQYRDYVLHGRQQFEDDHFNSSTATFGAVLLDISSARWKGVPVFLMSGKALDQKSSYIRVVFKDTAFNMGAPSETEITESIKELLFILSPQSGVGKVQGPSIAVSNSLLKVLPQGMIPKTKLKKITTENHTIYLYEGEDRAYSAVVSNVVHGRKDIFVGLKQLTASWNMWGLAISHLKSGALKLGIYDNGDVDGLRFAGTPYGLRFVRQIPAVSKDGDLFNIKHQLATAKVVVNSTIQVMEWAAGDLLKMAQISLKEGNSFHVGFPGGRSSKPLFHILTSKKEFPWRNTHVWFVDERCVPHDDAQSNFQNAEEQLLVHVGAPYSQVHPMPVDLARGLCNPEDLGAPLYEKWLKLYLNGGRLDVAVLGVGADGHIASLFPGSVHAPKEEESGDAEDPWVALSKAPPSLGAIEDRMTLTLKFLLKAKKLVVLVIGKDKHGVIDALLKGTQSADFPVSLLMGHDDLTFYVDEDAYHG